MTPAWISRIPERAERLLARPWAAWLVLVFASACVAWLRWLKMDGCWSDAARWVLEARRAASGEVPYLDFMWCYPPLSLWIMAGALRLLGDGFIALQIACDLVSLAVVLLSYRAGKLLLPRSAALGAALLVLAIGMRSGGEFELFSLKVYSPAIPVGTCGLLLLVAASGEGLLRGTLSVKHALEVALGSAICLLAKPEFGMAAAAVGAVSWLVSPRVPGLEFGRRSLLSRGAILVMLLAGPSATIYLALGRRVGFGNLVEAVSGYGMAKNVCPWWPTWLAIHSVIAHLALGWLLYVTLRVAGVGLNQVRAFGWLGVLVAVPAVASFLPIWMSRGEAASSVPGAVRFVVTPLTWLLAAMWWNILVVVRRLLYLARRVSLEPAQAVELVLGAACAAAATRGLFGTAMSELPVAPRATFAGLVIVGFMLLKGTLLPRGVPGTSGRARPWFAVSLLIVAACGIRAAAGIAVEASGRYEALQTPSGAVRLKEAARCALALSVALSVTEDGAPIADLAYGGLVNFALKRPPATYSTQFVVFDLSRSLAQLDVEYLRQKRPSLVIAADAPRLGTSVGVCAHTRCEFPKIVRRTERLACDPAEAHPVVETIESTYETFRRQDGLMFMRPVD